MSNVDEEGHLYSVRGSSGGYADTIFCHASKILFGEEIEGPLQFKTIRNSDFQEVTLEVSFVHPCVGSVDEHMVGSFKSSFESSSILTPDKWMPSLIF